MSDHSSSDSDDEYTPLAAGPLERGLIRLTDRSPPPSPPLAPPSRKRSQSKNSDQDYDPDDVHSDDSSSTAGRRRVVQRRKDVKVQKRTRKRKHNSCEPCRKRKVRCDRTSNCSNCKLHHQRCYWIDAEPLAVAEEDELVAAREEIQRLRLLVQMLTKHSNDTADAAPPTSVAETSTSEQSPGPAERAQTAFFFSSLAQNNEPSLALQPPPSHSHQSLYTNAPWPTQAYPNPSPPTQSYPPYTPQSWSHQQQQQYSMMGQSYYQGQFGGYGSK